jgi:MFS family permease
MAHALELGAQHARDRRSIYVATFARAAAIQMSAVLLALHLAARGFDARTIGTLGSVGLAGTAGWSLLATLAADRIGRRRMLLLFTLALVAGGVALVLGESLALLVPAFFLGAVNSMGRDRGAGLVVEQAVLPSTVGAEQRTGAFAVYNVLQDAGHAFGALLATLPELLARGADMSSASAMRATLWLYPAGVAVGALAYARLSPSVEPSAGRERARLSPQTRSVLWRISSLFAIDSLAGGLLTTTLLSYFFYERFGVDARGLGLLFFGARVLNAVSHVGAAWLAKRIGLVNTMVFTHIPSSLLLATVAFAPNFEVAAVLFLLREGLVEMDVPTRQSYVMAVVEPEVRTFASGVTNCVRLAAWAVGPAIAGSLMTGVNLYLPLLLGAALKITYDVLLYFAFRRLKPPEEV